MKTNLSCIIALLRDTIWIEELLGFVSLGEAFDTVLNVLATLQVLSGRHADETFEMASQMALIGKTGLKGYQRNHPAIA